MLISFIVFHLLVCINVQSIVHLGKKKGENQIHTTVIEAEEYIATTNLNNTN